MYKQSPARVQRSKRIGAKHVLQILVLLGVGFWLFYQLKRSHEKNVQHEESEVKGLVETVRVDEILNLGRKGIQDRFEVTIKGSIEEDNSEEGGDTGKNGENLSVAEFETHEEVDGDNEVEETESNGVQNLNEETDQEGDNTVPEARENQYKADDVSSAVTHDSETTDAENEEESEENEHSEIDTNERNDTDETTKSDTVEVTGSENGDDLENVERSLSETESSIDHLTSNNSTELATSNDDEHESIANVTVSIEEADIPESKSEDESNQSDPSTTENSVEATPDELDTTVTSFQDNSTSEISDGGENESKRLDEDDGKGDTEENEIPHENMDTISEIRSEGENMEGSLAE